MTPYDPMQESCRLDTSSSYEVHRHVARYQFAVERLRPLAPEQVVDVGCGSGYGDEMLLEVVGQVVGLDANPETVALARNEHPQPRLQFLQGDAQRLPFRDASFDAAVSLEVIEHVPEPDRMAQELSRVLKGGGCLILATPNRLFVGPPVRYPYHLRHYTPDELTALLAPSFGSVELWGMHVDPRIHALERSVPSRLVRAAKRALGLQALLLPASFHDAVSRLLYGKCREGLQPKDLHFSREDLPSATNLVAVCTR